MYNSLTMEMMVMSKLSWWHRMNGAGEGGWFTRGCQRWAEDNPRKTLRGPGGGGCEVGSQIRTSSVGLITHTNARNNLAQAAMCSGGPGTKRALEPRRQRRCPVRHAERGVLSSAAVRQTRHQPCCSLRSRLSSSESPPKKPCNTQENDV